MASITTNAFGTSSGVEHPARLGLRIRCALLGHEFITGMAGVVLRLPTCQRCGQSAQG